MNHAASTSDMPRAVYDFDGKRLTALDDTFLQAVSDAHRRHARPRCQCRPVGVPMYVARLGGGFVVKRMPETGSQHAPNCRSFGDVVVREEQCEPMRAQDEEPSPASYETLDLAFALRNATGQPTGRPSRPAPRRATRHGLTLRELLHLLWERAGLNEWHPAFAGKRNWAVVRWRLMKAAEGLMLHTGEPLADRLYIPEVFCVEEREAITRRRLQRWADFADPNRPQQRLLLIGEVKAVWPAPQGVEMRLKHLPDLIFTARDEAAAVLLRLVNRECHADRPALHSHNVLIGTVDDLEANDAILRQGWVARVGACWSPLRGQ